MDTHNTLYTEFKKSRYLYRLIMYMNRSNLNDSLALCHLLLIHAKRRIYSIEAEAIQFTRTLEIQIAEAIAAGISMDDWIAQQASIGMRDLASLRKSWKHVAYIISTYIIKADYAEIDPGSQNIPNPQQDIPDLVRLSF